MPNIVEGNISVTRKGYIKKSGYITFDPGRMSIINWKPTRQYQDLEPNKANIGE